MRNYDKYKNTKFIQQSEIENSPHGSILVTIDNITEENVAPESRPENIKYVIHFKENYKPWAPGVETLEVIKNIAGTGNIDDWFGTRIVLYIDPNVSFQGKVTGGIRCRPPKNQPETQQQDEPIKAEFCEECNNLKEECTCASSLSGDDIPY